MPKTRPGYPPEFRREAVQMLRAGRTPRELAKSLGVSEQTLPNWRRQDEADRRVRTDLPSSAELEELRALRRENARLKQERDLLKRAATLAFTGAHLTEAKLGLLGAAALAPVATWIVIRGTQLLPCPRQITALLGGTAPLIDLTYDVEPARDHIRGPLEATVTVVEFGDFECPFCGRAEPHVRELLREFADVRYVWRHLPLSDVHPRAQMAAEAAEAAAAQNAFWPMHDLLLAHQDALEIGDLLGYAQRLGLDAERFAGDLQAHLGAKRIAENVEEADLSGVTGTPTFFVNGLRHYGPYDIVSLTAVVRAAEAHVRLLSRDAERRVLAGWAP